MSRDDHNNLPSYRDFMENPDDLPSVEEFKEENLPSVEDFLEKTVEEETQTIENSDGESFLEVTDVVQAPEWSELVRLVNDVRKDIPKVPEIRYYDEQLEEICAQIAQIQDNYAKRDKIDVLSVQNEEFEGKLFEIESKIPTVKYYDHDINSIYDKITDIKEEIKSLPEVKYYEEDLESLKSRIEQVNEAIPTFPDWIQEVQEVPDFSWIGKTFSLIDDDFNKVQGHIDVIKEKIDREVNELNESLEVKEFEFKVDVKNLSDNLDQTNDRITETKDKIYQEIKEASIRIWELRNTFKDDDRKLKKSVLSEQNKLKQSLETQIKEINEQSVKTDESILKFFTDLKETVDTLPEVKYYDEDVSRIDSDILSLRKELKELTELASLIKTEQTELKENYLLNEPPEEKERASGQVDPLTPIDQNFATLEDLSNHYRLFLARITTQLSTMGGGGAGFIKDLDDVEFDGTTGEGKLLIYDQSRSKWVGIASTALGGGGGSGPGVAGTWSVDSVGIHTTKNVGIGTTAAVTNKALYVVGDGQFTGNVTVGGTLIYEDVKNVDSIGLITARTGVDVLSGGINVTGVSTFNSDVSFNGDINGNVTIVSTDDGSAAAPELTLYRNSASPAPGDYLGQLMFKGENSNGGQENYAKITGKITDETLGTEDGLIETAIKGNGSFTIVSRQRSDELQLLNGVGLSVDGDSTFTGGIDVDGHTELDDVNVSGVITATSFVGDGSGLTGVASTDYIITGTAATFNNHVDFNNNIYHTGIATFGASNGIGTVHIGLGQTALFVDGNARIVGIFTVGRSSVTIDGENNTISVGLVTVTNSTIILGDNVTLDASATGINSAPNVLYVAKDGDDTSNGTSIDNAKLTIEAAVGIAQSGTVIKVLSGNYVENNPITLPAFVAVVGDDQRTVKVLPSNTTQDIFHVNKGCKLANMTFSGHLAPSAAVAFPTAGATNVGGGKWKGPYIQNCTSDTTTGTGIRVDGDKAVLTKSMNVDAFTQYNQGGVGVAITNQGYAQLVSVFTICCNEAITAHKGGQADLANSNCSFGTYGLVADGVSPEQFTGIVTSSGAAGQDNIVVNVGAVTTRPYDGQVVYFDQLYKSVETITITSGGSGYTSTPSVTISSPTGPNGEVATAFATLENGVVTEIDIISSGSQYTGTATVTISAPDSGTTATATANMADTYYTINSSTPITAGITTLTLAENLLNTVGVASTAYFFQQSKIIASSHTFEYIGSGNDITSATPKRGGVTIQANEVVTQNGGSVIYTSTDQSGNFRIGDEFQINQSTGTISGRAFSKSLFSEMTPFILALS